MKLPISLEAFLTFKEYLAKRRVKENIQGDFVKEARCDPQLPDVTSWAELKPYLERSGVYRSALQAASLVWTAYQAELKKKAMSKTSRASSGRADPAPTLVREEVLRR